MFFAFILVLVLLLQHAQSSAKFDYRAGIEKILRIIKSEDVEERDELVLKAMLLMIKDPYWSMASVAGITANEAQKLNVAGNSDVSAIISKGADEIEDHFVAYHGSETKVTELLLGAVKDGSMYIHSPCNRDPMEADGMQPILCEFYNRLLVSSRMVPIPFSTPRKDIESIIAKLHLEKHPFRNIYIAMALMIKADGTPYTIKRIRDLASCSERVLFDEYRKQFLSEPVDALLNLAVTGRLNIDGSCKEKEVQMEMIECEFWQRIENAEDNEIINFRKRRTPAPRKVHANSSATNIAGDRSDELGDGEKRKTQLLERNENPGSVPQGKKRPRENLPPSNKKPRTEKGSTDPNIGSVSTNHPGNTPQRSFGTTTNVDTKGTRENPMELSADDSLPNQDEVMNSAQPEVERQHQDDLSSGLNEDSDLASAQDSNKSSSAVVTKNRPIVPSMHDYGTDNNYVDGIRGHLGLLNPSQDQSLVYKAMSLMIGLGWTVSRVVNATETDIQNAYKVKYKEMEPVSVLKKFIPHKYMPRHLYISHDHSWPKDRTLYSIEYDFYYRLYSSSEDRPLRLGLMTYSSDSLDSDDSSASDADDSLSSDELPRKMRTSNNFYDIVIRLHMVSVHYLTIYKVMVLMIMKSQVFTIKYVQNLNLDKNTNNSIIKKAYSQVCTTDPIRQLLKLANEGEIHIKSKTKKITYEMVQCEFAFRLHVHKDDNVPVIFKGPRNG